MKKALQWLFFTWFNLLLLDSPIRYFLNNFHLVGLFYIKDILLLIIIVYGIALTIKSENTINMPLIIVVIIIILNIIIGLMNQLNLLQILFGIKIFLPLLAGIVIAKHKILEVNQLITLYRISIPIIMIGLGLQYYFKILPWTGFDYTFGGFVVKGNRYWTTFGIPRLSGFQRSSFESAIILFLLDMFYLFSIINEKKDVEVMKLEYYGLYDAFLFILSIIGIIYTTSKTVYLAEIMLVVIYLILVINLRTENIKTKTLSLIVIKLVLGVLFLFSIVPPLISFVNPNYIREINLSTNYFARWFFASFIDRMESTWPTAFSLITHSRFKILGRGIGGIGAPQQYFEPRLYNPGDNIFVYLYVIFGYLILAVIIWLTTKIITLKIEQKSDISIIFFLLSLFSIGATLNAIESPFFSMSIGILIAKYYSCNESG